MNKRQPSGEKRETRTAETPAGKGESGDEQRPGLGDHEPLDRNEHVEQERGLDRIDGVEVVHVEPPYRLAPPRRGRKLQRRWIDRHRGKEQSEDIDSCGECKKSDEEVAVLVLARGPPRRIGLAQTVERNGEHDDGKASLDTRADVEPPKRGQDVIAEAARTDHRGDDHHVEREHDDLIDADEKLRPRCGKHHLEQHLPSRGACHGAVLDDLARNGL